MDQSSSHLSKSILGPVLDLSTPGQRACIDIDLWHRRFRWGWHWGFPPLLAPVCDGEATLAFILQVDPGQEVCGDMLGFDPRAGAHFSLSSLVEGYEPLAASSVVSVDHWGVRVVAVLLEPLPELAVIREPLLKIKETTCYQEVQICKCSKCPLPNLSPLFAPDLAEFDLVLIIISGNCCRGTPEHIIMIFF